MVVQLVRAQDLWAVQGKSGGAEAKESGGDEPVREEHADEQDGKLRGAGGQERGLCTLEESYASILAL